MSPVTPLVAADIIGSGRVPLAVCFGAFVITFIVTRLITRMIRAGRGPFKDNVSESGLHIHHAVPGIILLVIGAFMAIAVDTDSPWAIAAALFVGVGTSLVLDEFALILHLEDVYWLQEGRISIEMIALAMGCLGLVLVGLEPFNFLKDDNGKITLGSALLALAIVLPFLVVCVLKGKYRMTLFSLFVFPVAIVGAVRLARPAIALGEVALQAREARRAPTTDRAPGRPLRPDRVLGQRLRRRQAVELHLSTRARSAATDAAAH